MPVDPSAAGSQDNLVINQEKEPCDGEVFVRHVTRAG